MSIPQVKRQTKTEFEDEKVRCKCEYTLYIGCFTTKDSIYFSFDKIQDTEN